MSSNLVLLWECGEGMEAVFFRIRSSGDFTDTTGLPAISFWKRVPNLRLLGNFGRRKLHMKVNWYDNRVYKHRTANDFKVKIAKSWSFWQKSKGVTIQMKDLDEYILTVPFMLLLEEVRFLAFRDWQWRLLQLEFDNLFDWKLSAYQVVLINSTDIKCTSYLNPPLPPPHPTPPHPGHMACLYCQNSTLQIERYISNSNPKRF